MGGHPLASREPRAHRARASTCFFTLALAERGSRLLTEHVDRLRAAFVECRRRRPFAIEAIVVLPDHLHVLLTLPEGAGDDFAALWRSVKGRFSRSVNARRAGIGAAPCRPGRIWRTRYWMRAIAGEAELRAHVDYIHADPVHHGHVPRPADWPYSSFHRYVRHGWRDAAWVAAPELRARGGFGE